MGRPRWASLARGVWSCPGRGVPAAIGGSPAIRLYRVRNGAKSPRTERGARRERGIPREGEPEMGAGKGVGSGYLLTPLGPVLPAVSVGSKSRRPSRAGKVGRRLEAPAWCRCGSRPRCRSLRDLPLKLRQSRRRREGGEGREEGRGGRRGQSPGGGAGTARAWGRGRGHPPGAGPFATAAASPGGRSVCSPPFPAAPFAVAAGPPRRGGGGAPGLTPLGPSCDGAAPPRALNPTGKGWGGERAVKGEEEGAAGPSRRGYAPIAKGKIGGSSGAKPGTTLGSGSNRTSPRDGPGPGSAPWPGWVPRRPDKEVPRLRCMPEESPIRGAEVRLHVPTLRPPGADPARSRVPAPLSWHGGAAPGAGPVSAPLPRSARRVARARPRPACASTELPGYRCCTPAAPCTPSSAPSPEHELLHTPRCTQTLVHARLDARPALHTHPWTPAGTHLHTLRTTRLLPSLPRTPTALSHLGGIRNTPGPLRHAWLQRNGGKRNHSTARAQHRLRQPPGTAPAPLLSSASPGPGPAQGRGRGRRHRRAGDGYRSQHSVFWEARESQRCTNPS